MKLGFITSFYPFIWLALIWLSLKNLRSSFQIVFENITHLVLTNKNLNRFNHMLRGTALSLLTLSTATVSLFLTSMQSGGLIQVNSAISQAIGAHIGSSLYLLFIFLAKIPLLDIVFVVSFVLLLFFQKQKGRNVLWLIFSIGLLAISEKVLFNSKIELEAFGHFAFLQNNDFGVNLLVFIISLIISVILRSSFIFSLFCFPLYGAGIMSLENLMIVLFSSPIGEGIFTSFISKSTIQTAKRIAFFNLILKVFNFLFFIVFNVQILKFFSESDSQLLVISKTILVVIGTSLLVGCVALIFLNKIVDILEKIYPEMEMKESFQLRHVGPTELNLPSISLAQVNLHLVKMNSIVQRMFNLTRDYLEEDAQPRMLAKIKDYERIIDNMREESNLFEKHLAQKVLTSSQAEQLGLYDQIASHLESIADYVDKLAIYKTNIGEGVSFDDVVQKEVVTFMDEVYEFYAYCIWPLSESQVDSSSALSSLDINSKELKKKAQTLRLKIMRSFEDIDSHQEVMLNWLDIIFALRKIRGHAMSIRRVCELF